MDAAPALAKPIEVEAQGLHYARGGRVIMHDLSCRFPAGRISVVVGASGCGKTTLLRMIACLNRPHAGRILIDGTEDVAHLSDGEVHAFRRRVGMLFQGGALLDSMTVFDNVALPLREHSGFPESRIRDEVHRVFEAVGLANVDELLPGQLSGGMVKRAGLARALVERPDLLLCDEPFSGLDPPTIRRIEELLLFVNQNLGGTMIITSHHNETTMRIADHVVMMVDRAAVSGRPRELLAGGDARVAEFFADVADSVPGAAP
ncbi:MAG: ABC transporter ATP-binding protein [Proteobacteria bacterium]|nr:MAG: ABC transporter ATP-binding protein [Pseudomonadota bacterium]